MTTCSKRAIITLRPEWAPELDQLKQEQFYNDTQAEMFRYIISRGLDALKQEKAEKEKGQGRSDSNVLSTMKLDCLFNSTK